MAIQKVTFAEVAYKKRWFTHIDILGFTKLVQHADLNDVLDAYEEALDALKSKADMHRGKGVSHTWFSDTFIIFSEGSSLQEFTLVEQVSRLFFCKLLYQGIPSRGALTFGDLYTQKKKNIFIGPALVDSYQYGEDQDWVGFVLTPQAVNELESQTNDLPRYYKPIPDKVMRKYSRDGVLACDFVRSGSDGLIRCLKELQNKAKSNKVKAKYRRALDFVSAS